ncbi:MAG TPA: hypothetical protein VL049_04895 [Candidatus Dormibacteraeota bacterium]|nr:hypothetical protein [Candidatus Dormibacteraeota bacterium]
MGVFSFAGCDVAAPAAVSAHGLEIPLAKAARAAPVALLRFVEMAAAR